MNQLERRLKLEADYHDKTGRLDYIDKYSKIKPKDYISNHAIKINKYQEKRKLSNQKKVDQKFNNFINYFKKYGAEWLPLIGIPIRFFNFMDNKELDKIETLKNFEDYTYEKKDEISLTREITWLAWQSIAMDIVYHLIK